MESFFYRNKPCLFKLDMYPESCIILSHCPTTISDGGSQINKLAAVVVHTVVDHHGRLLEDIKPLYFAVAVLSFLCCCLLMSYHFAHYSSHQRYYLR